MKKDINHHIYLMFLLYALILSEELESGEEPDEMSYIHPLERVVGYD